MVNHQLHHLFPGKFQLHMSCHHRVEDYSKAECNSFHFTTQFFALFLDVHGGEILGHVCSSFELWFCVEA